MLRILFLIFLGLSDENLNGADGVGNNTLLLEGVPNLLLEAENALFVYPPPPILFLKIFLLILAVSLRIFLGFGSLSRFIRSPSGGTARRTPNCSLS